MYRKIMDYLKEWKHSEHRKPLILQGARQVGKTYSILEFGRTCYENVAYFNFETNPKLNATFAENISPDYLIPILSHIAGQTIIREKTLIVFDEVQLCERASEFENAIEWLCLSGIVSQLSINGYHTYYWKSARGAEIDFVIQREGKLVPIEVKSADNTRAKSLKVYMDTYEPDYAIESMIKSL